MKIKELIDAKIEAALKPERLLAGDGYAVENSGFGKRLMIDFPAIEPMENDSSYSGPFAVVKLNNTQARLLSYSPDEGRLVRNTVILGLQTLEVPGWTVSVASTSYIILRVQGGASYQFWVFASDNIPAQTTADAYLPLAHVTWAGGRIAKVQQLHYGIVAQLGRVF